MNQIQRIAPISDADAARLVSDTALADLAGQITMTPAGPARIHSTLLASEALRAAGE